MLRISKLADYGTVIMNYLSLNPEGILSAPKIAQELQIPMPTVSKVLKLLSASQLVHSVRGAEGGYRLGRPPEQIPIIEVIAAIDGQPAMTECSMHGKVCVQGAVCAVRNNWRIVNQMIVNFLRHLTLADMSLPLQQHPLLAQGFIFGHYPNKEEKLPEVVS